jgi:signal transduction histidine kinase
MSAAPHGHVFKGLELQGEQSRRYLSLQDLKNIALFGLAYLAAYGYGSLFAQKSSAPLWLPDSVLLCALLLAPKKKWWIYLLLAVPIRFMPGVRPHVATWFLWATFSNDAIKAMLAAHLLRYVTGNNVRFNTVRKYVAYLGIAVLLVPMLSAFFGAMARRALGFAFWPAFGQWFLGNALTNIVVTPTLLLWFSGEYRHLRARMGEVTLWAVGFAFCLRYTMLLTGSNESPIALYVPFPFLVWAAARLGAIGASSGLSLTALFLMLGISRTNGAFALYPAQQYMHFVQLFLGFTALPIMFVAILFEDRQGVEQRLRDNQQELNKNYERIRDLAGRLIGAQEEERKRIARELHDDISQQIALLTIGLDKLARTPSAGGALERSQLLELRHRTEEVAESVREVAHQLHSATLQHLGITRGLEGLCTTFSQQHHIAVNLEIEPLRGLSDHLSLCLFRIVQEALNNAVKHGQAKQISVRLARSAGSLRLEIKDTGTGFNPSAASEGLGLVSMRERLRMVGGTLTIRSSHGQGTLIEAVVDMAARQAAS